jgi:hypothetical protein
MFRLLVTASLAASSFGAEFQFVEEQVVTFPTDNLTVTDFEGVSDECKNETLNLQGDEELNSCQHGLMQSMRKTLQESNSCDNERNRISCRVNYDNQYVEDNQDCIQEKCEALGGEYSEESFWIPCKGVSKSKGWGSLAYDTYSFCMGSTCTAEEKALMVNATLYREKKHLLHGGTKPTQLMKTANLLSVPQNSLVQQLLQH